MRMRSVFLILCGFCLLLSGAFGSGKEEAKKAEGWAGKTLQVIGHRVHMATASGAEGKGEDLVQAFRDKHSVDVVYQTFESARVGEKFYQLGPLNNTEEDVIHLNLAMQIKKDMKNFLVPLTSFLKEKPIEGFPEAFGALPEALKVDGDYYAIPIRAGNWAMWYNKKIFAERGVSGPPKTAEEFYDIAKKLTHQSASGAKIFGWSSRGDLGHAGQMLAIMARMWDGDVITPDFKVTVNEAPVINALNLMRKMYAEGIMPPDWHTYGYAGSIKIFREGNVAMVLEASNYWPTFNDPEKSKIAGNAVVAPYPLSAKLATSKRDFSSGSSWFWAQGILKGSQDQELAYEYISHLATQHSAMNMALSGNPPARIDVLSDPKYLDINPGAKIDAMVAPFTATWIPAFPKNKAVGDIVSEHTHNVVVQGKPAQKEMDEAAKRLKALLP